MIEHWGLWFVRYGLGITIALAGIVGAPLGMAIEVSGMFVGGGLAILLLNALFRLGAGGDAEREEEERAREYFDKHGRWPGE